MRVSSTGAFFLLSILLISIPSFSDGFIEGFFDLLRVATGPSQESFNQQQQQPQLHKFGPKGYSTKVRVPKCNCSSESQSGSSEILNKKCAVECRMRHLKQGGNSGSGICSWYGAEGEIKEGWPTACGEGFSRFAIATAHPSLPCGTRIRVTNQNNGQSIDVRVNDRGPFVPGRILDLTYEAFGRIANRDTGVIPCSYVVL